MNIYLSGNWQRTYCDNGKELSTPYTKRYKLSEYTFDFTADGTTQEILKFDNEVLDEPKSKAACYPYFVYKDTDIEDSKSTWKLDLDEKTILQGTSFLSKYTITYLKDDVMQLVSIWSSGKKYEYTMKKIN
jgi:hypothetical protein